MTPYYSHAGITIYHGDCREILPQLDRFDLCLTDPPYGLGENQRRNLSRARGGHATDYGEFEWDSERCSDERILLSLGIAEYSIIWGGNYFASILKDGPGWLVWDKLNSGDFADAELAWSNLPQACWVYRHRWNGMIRQSENDVPRCHPTQKPVALMQWCLQFAPECQSVIDPFMGSGPVLLAAKIAGIRAVGIDKEERYCEIAAKRLAQEVFDFTGAAS